MYGVICAPAPVMRPTALPVGLAPVNHTLPSGEAARARVSMPANSARNVPVVVIRPIEGSRPSGIGRPSRTQRLPSGPVMMSPRNRRAKYDVSAPVPGSIRPTDPSSAKNPVSGDTNQSAPSGPEMIAVGFRRPVGNSVILSDEPALHTPARHVSPMLHALPSSQGVPSGCVGFEQAPDVGLHVPTSWHGSLAAHATGLVPAQMPARHVSVCVQALPSLQAVPLGLLGLEQVPEVGLQVPGSWHWSLAVQTTGLAPAHTPPWQVSVRVQALLSLQAAPLGLLGLEQVPEVGLQVPGSWH